MKFKLHLICPCILLTCNLLYYYLFTEYLYYTLSRPYNFIYFCISEPLFYCLITYLVTIGILRIVKISVPEHTRHILMKIIVGFLLIYFLIVAALFLNKEVIAFARIGQYLIIPFFFLGELAAFFFIK